MWPAKFSSALCAKTITLNDRKQKRKGNMTTDNILKDKAILIVDDEPDILDSITEQLDMCRIYRAMDYEIALQLMAGFNSISSSLM
jgi:hypothetical protein